MAQWAKFVRPGFKRIDATKNPTTNVYVSAYKSGDQVVIVAVNTNTSSKSLSFSIANTKVTKFTQYTTSASKSLGNDGSINVASGGFSATIDASSVATWVGDITVGLINPGFKNRTNTLSFPAKELSECKMYDLRGRQINSTRIGALKRNGSALNVGVYIVKNNKSESTRYFINK
jgi:hypothetical protein